MANTILAVETSNTFNQWRIVTNSLVLAANELRNNTYIKEGGGIQIANGTIQVVNGVVQIDKSTGTNLYVAANATIVGTLTVGNVSATNFSTPQLTDVQNQANLAYTAANNAANTVRVTANSLFAQSAVGLNFINTASVTVSVGAGTSGNANVAFSAVAGTTAVAGILQLTDSTTSTSTTTAATPNSVRTANVIAISAYGQANLAYAQANTAYGQANAAYGRANLAYTTANNAANTVRVTANSLFAQSAVGLNFINTASVTVSVGAGSTGNANVGFSAVAGTTSIAGILQLTDSVTSTSTTTAATPNSVRTANAIAISAYDQANNSANTVRVTANSLFAQTAVSLNFINTASVTVSVGAGSTGNANIAFSAVTGTTAVAGILQLTDSVTSTSTTTAATPNSVKTTFEQATAGYAQANGAYNQANAAYTQANTARTEASAAANTVRVTANSLFAQTAVSLNFINTASVRVSVGAGSTGNANVSFSLPAVLDSLAVTSLTATSLTVTNPIIAPSESDSASYRLRVSQTTRGDGTFGVNQGGANGNAEIKFASSSGVWQITSNSIAGAYYNIITSQNVSDSVATTSSVNVASSTAVKSAFDQATLGYSRANTAYAAANNAANTVRVTANSGSAQSAVSLNFNNTSTVLVSVGAGTTGNANISFSVIPSFTTQVNTTSSLNVAGTGTFGDDLTINNNQPTLTINASGTISVLEIRNTTGTADNNIWQLKTFDSSGTLRLQALTDAGAGGGGLLDIRRNAQQITGVILNTVSSNDALRITQTGTGNAFVVEDSTNPDSTPFVIDASGNVGIGISNPTSVLHVGGSGTIIANIASTLPLSGGLVPVVSIGNIDSLRVSGETTLFQKTRINNITPASFAYSGKFFNVNTEESVPLGFTFKPDGTKMYVTGQAGDDVNEYNLTTPWDASTAAYLQKTVTLQDASPSDVAFSSNGTYVYTSGQTTGNVYQYYLSVPWSTVSLTSATGNLVATYNVAAQDISAAVLSRGITFSEDGVYLYVSNATAGGVAPKILQFRLSPPWELASATYIANSGSGTVLSSTGSTSFASDGITFNNDGSLLQIADTTNKGVNFYYLKTPWMIANGISFFSNVAFPDGSASGRGVALSPDGRYLNILEGTNKNVYTFTTNTISSFGVVGNSDLYGDVSVYNKLTAGSANINGPVVISACSSSDALRITQTGSGNALVIEDEANPDTSPFVIDSSGRAIIGNATGVYGISNVIGSIQLHANGTSGFPAVRSRIQSYSWGGDSTFGVPILELGKSGAAGSNIIGTHVSVGSGDRLGTVRFAGSDGTEFQQSSQIVGEVDGTPSAGVVPGRLVFATVATTGTLVERMRISNTGFVGIGNTAPNHTLSVGGNVFVSGLSTFSSLVVSDMNVTQTIVSAYGQANLAYSQANTANTIAISAYAAANTGLNKAQVSANGGSVQSNVGINFNNTSTVLVSVGPGTTGNANVTFSVIPKFTTEINTTSSLSVTGNATFSNSVTISMSNDFNALRINQSGTNGNAIVIEDSTNPDSSPFVIDSSGKVIIGHTAGVSGVNYIAALQLQGYGTTGVPVQGSKIQAMHWGGEAVDSGQIDLYKSGALAPNTIGTHVLVSNNDRLGALRFYGSNGTLFAQGTSIASYVDGVASATSMPGRIEFSTTPAGSTTGVERMTIRNTGNIGIGNSAPNHTLSVSGNTFVSGAAIFTGTVVGSPVDIVSASTSYSENAAGKTIVMNGATSITLTFGPAAYSGFVVDIIRKGTGNVTIANTSSIAKLNVASAQPMSNISSRYATARVTYTATNEFILTGSITP